MHSIHQPILEHAIYERAWSPITKMMSRMRAGTHLKYSTNWSRKEIVERYRRFKKEDTQVANSLMDAILIDRIHSEQAGQKSLEQDDPWVDLLIVQLKSLLLGGLSTTTDTICVSLASIHEPVLPRLVERGGRPILILKG